LKIVPIQQGSHNWKLWRRNKITATDAAIIMNSSIYATKDQLWAQKKGLLLENEVNENMKRGIALEEKARERFEEVTGISVAPIVVKNEEREWQAASLDGYDPWERIVLEIKCPTPKNFHQYKLEIPEMYMWQMMHQYSVTDCKYMYFMTYCNGNHHILPVFRNHSFIDRMIDKEKEFYDRLQDDSFTPW
jgi:putative phage-type endonuclease